MKPLVLLLLVACLPLHAEQARSFSIYDAAVLGTDIPAELFRALSMAESDEMDSATGDDGASIGRYQINERFRAERVRLYGEYNPRDPRQAGRVAAQILQAYYERFGSWPLALTAYNAGSGYASKIGIRWAYVDRVQMMLERMGSRLQLIRWARGLIV